MNEINVNMPNEVVRLSDLDIARLEIKNELFVPLNVDRQKKEMNYNTQKLFCADDIRNQCDDLEIFRYLINLSKLELLINDYSFSMDPINLYYDFNMEPRVLNRNLFDENFDFITNYKAVIASLLNPKYTFSDYIQGGLSLMQENKFLSKIYVANDVEDIVNILKKEYLKRKKISKNNFFKVSKKISIFAICIFILMTSLFVYSSIKLYNYQQSRNDEQTELSASLAFNKKEYSTVIKDLKDIKTKELNDDMLYILAVSYIETSSLEALQKHNALAQVRSDTNKEYNLFWVYLGREEFKKAYDIASGFDDDRLLYYAYSVEYASIPTNNKMSAEEKAARKDELKKLLDNYVSKIKGKK